MVQVRAIVAQVTQQAQVRWTQFWRWWRTANRRTQVAVGVSTVIGVVVLSSLAVAALQPTARPDTSQVHNMTPQSTVRATPGGTVHGHGHGRGHGHHTSQNENGQ